MNLVSPALIVFKESSPSCGIHRVDIEKFWKAGCGVVTAMIHGLDIPIISEKHPLPDFSNLCIPKLDVEEHLT